MAKHPKRFGAIATLPGKTIDGSLSEMEYALDTLKMDGVSTLTSVEDMYLGDSRFDPLSLPKSPHTLKSLQLQSHDR